jgi:hypothetical protein
MNDSVDSYDDSANSTMSDYATFSRRQLADLVLRRDETIVKVNKRAAKLDQQLADAQRQAAAKHPSAHAHARNNETLNASTVLADAATRAELQEVRLQEETRSIELRASEARCAQLRDTVIELNAQVEMLDAESQSIHATEVQKLQGEVDAARVAMVTMSEQWERSQARWSDEMNDRLKYMTANLARVTEAASEQRATIEQQDEQAAALRGGNHALREEMAAKDARARAAANVASVDAFELRRTLRREEEERVKALQTEQAATLASLRDTHAAEMAAVRRDANETANMSVVNNQSQAQDADDFAAAMQRQRERHASETATLAAQLRGYHDAVSRHEAANDEVRSMLSDATAAIADRDAHIEQQRRRFTRVQRLLRDMRSERERERETERRAADAVASAASAADGETERDRDRNRERARRIDEAAAAEAAAVAASAAADVHARLHTLDAAVLKRARSAEETATRLAEELERAHAARREAEHRCAVADERTRMAEATVRRRTATLRRERTRATTAVAAAAASATERVRRETTVAKAAGVDVGVAALHAVADNSDDSDGALTVADIAVDDEDGHAFFRCGDGGRRRWTSLSRGQLLRASRSLAWRLQRSKEKNSALKHAATEHAAVHGVTQRTPKRHAAVTRTPLKRASTSSNGKTSESGGSERRGKKKKGSRVRARDDEGDSNAFDNDAYTKGLVASLKAANERSARLRRLLFAAEDTVLRLRTRNDNDSNGHTHADHHAGNNVDDVHCSCDHSD